MVMDKYIDIMEEEFIYPTEEEDIIVQVSDKKQVSFQVPESQSKKKIPKRVFIVPYRNRPQQKFFFRKWMSFLLENDDDYEVYFSHQFDERPFNRGATRNIGFLVMKQKYPDNYKDINFIFNDVDTLPFNKIFDYTTYPGVVTHYYGFTHALGGIVVIKGGDFERINGYPCYWGWGSEDNVLQYRCNVHQIHINRASFFPIGSPEILQLFDGITRIINPKDHDRMISDNGIDGLSTIRNLTYTIDSFSANEKDNVFQWDNPRMFYINIDTFLPYIPFNIQDNYKYDLRESSQKTYQPDPTKKTDQTVIKSEDWKNIPNQLSESQKREMQARQFISRGLPVPIRLAQQIQRDNQIESIHSRDHYNTNSRIIDPEKLRGVSPFSPEYAKLIGEKPKATSSIRIGLGGIRR